MEIEQRILIVYHHDIWKPIFSAWEENLILPYLEKVQLDTFGEENSFPCT